MRKNTVRADMVSVSTACAGVCTAEDPYFGRFRIYQNGTATAIRGTFDVIRRTWLHATT